MSVLAELVARRRDADDPRPVDAGDASAVGPVRGTDSSRDGEVGADA